MKFKLLIGFVSISLALSACGKKTSSGTTDSSGEIELKLNLTKGKKYAMEFNMDNTVEMNMMGQSVNSTNKIIMGGDYEVMDVLPSGNFLVRTTYRKIKMNGDAMGMKYEYDSETDKASGPQGEQMATSMKKMIGEYMEMEMDKTGKVIKTTSSPALTENDKEGKPKKSGFENMQFNVFPDKKLKVGDTWENSVEQNMNGTMVDLKSTYTLTAVNNGIAEVKIEGTFTIKPGSEGKFTGSQKGTSKIEIATGICTEAIIDQDIDMEANNMGMKMPMKMKNKITVTLK